MFADIKILENSSMMAQHASARQKLVSTNLANVDTPNYVPRDIAPFSDFIGMGVDLKIQPENSRIFDETSSESWSPKPGLLEGKPSGNSVSVEEEILKSVEIERQHSKALAIYQHAMDVLKISIGRGR
ncbi:MAG: hypothetical protein ABJN34_06650 [Litoreibacter sp.]|uniref:hypothetical protein n=1 Tax=Litoreibacter sp. TaxID=1969459 RepID=UPI003299C2B9